MTGSYLLKMMKLQTEILTSLKPSIIILLTLQKIWEYLTRLMTLRTVRIFPYKGLFFSNHPCIQMIKDKYQNTFNFKFEPVSTDQVKKFSDETDCNKSSSEDIPAKIIEIVKKEIAEPIGNCINSSI